MKRSEKWNLALQLWRGEGWSPLPQYEPKSYAQALDAARYHVCWAEERWLDPRNLAIFSFSSGVFEELPWNEEKLTGLITAALLLEIVPDRRVAPHPVTALPSPRPRKRETRAGVRT
jgi:hypothetical protein